MKQLVDFLPVAAFFGVYLLADIYYATMALMVAAALQVGYFKVRGLRVTGQMWVVFWAAMIFGTMTLVFRNALFIQWRGSVVNWIMALALVGSRFIGSGDVIKRMLGKMLTLPDRAWRALTYGWAGVFAASGSLNLFVAYNFSEEAWVAYKFASGFVVPILLIGGSVAYLVATKQLPTAPAEDASGGEAKPT
ncbi:MAG: septation protein IspZ [Gammaproteobacteria bacterium]|nr:septation protein IspZ [Gammaproteobacteria bacterium]